MTAYFVEAQAVLPYTSGLPRDVAVNTFHFRADDSLSDLVVGTIIENRIKSFYNDVATGAAATVRSFISAVVSRTTDACTTKCYKLSDPLPRAPFHIDSWTLGAADGNTSLPLEVALCTSFRGPYDSGVAQASRRGRMFIGPLSAVASTTVANAAPVPTASFITALKLATQELCEDDSEPLVRFIQYSRKLSAGIVPEAGWVDNEFDTQRRRQVKATARSTWAT